MSESSDQASGFWTLTRPTKLAKRRNSDLHELHHKVFNISVVGLSGVEKDKGPIGIGKSCFCNRFIRSAADDYHTEHLSVLSQSDFSGRVVNNDHWLYWGSVIKSCDGYDLAFNVIEQTEFVDDACFQPFKSGKTEPYFRRCANTKLVSAEKLMYICKNQLGVEREYEQRYLPDGKFNVDGFLCLFDVSAVQGRDIDKQVEMTRLIMLNLMKTKKPTVFATTKHDEANEILVAEAERLVNQRDFRGLVPLVETSAQDNVNVNIAFLLCAQLIDKTRAKLRIPSYFEAYKNHLDLLNAASDAYLGLVRSAVTDYRSSWQQVCMKLSHNPEFLRYTYLHGLDKATIVFNNHLKALQDGCINQKVQNFLKVFPDILNELVPQKPSNSNLINSNNNNNIQETAKHPDSSYQAWTKVQDQLRSHHLFNKYFIQTPDGISWYETELLNSTDPRIPSDWLESDEAFSIFQQRNLIIETEQKRQTMKETFAQMLSNTKISVGKPFIELKHLFVGNASLEILTEQELFEVYVEYQNNLLQQARDDFQELLLENAEHLHHLTSNNKVIRQEDIITINAILQHDERYQALDRFDQDRTLMLIRHLSFLHSQISEQCPSYPKCVEPEIERLLITKAKSLVSRYYEMNQENKSIGGASGLHLQQTCDLVIFGPRRPSQQLILALNVLNSRATKGSQYQITFTIFDSSDEVDNQIQRFRQSNTKLKGCFGIFTNQRSLEHVSYTIEKFLLLSSQINDDRNHFGSPPIVMLYAADITLDERTMLTLESEGQKMADRFNCPFMNVTAIDQYRQHQQHNILANDLELSCQTMSECASLDYACVDASFNVLKEAISRKVCFMELYNNQDLIPRQAFNPDARILMCLLCGEPFSNELFMWKMFLYYEDCYVTSSKSICLRVRLDNGQEKYIEIIITSYTHGAFTYREDLLHGFILVCSIDRKASISILNAFSFNIPCTPVLVMAIKGDLTLNNRPDSDVFETLIEEAQAAAKRLKGHFEVLEISETDRTNIVEDTYSNQRIKSFLQNVIRWKPTIEKAYELGDSDMPLPSSSAYDSELSNSFHRTPLLDSQPITKAKDIEKDTEKLRQHHHAGTLDDEAINENIGGLERNLSEESEVYSTTSNSIPPKPVRSTKSKEDPHEQHQNNKFNIESTKFNSIDHHREQNYCFDPSFMSLCRFKTLESHGDDFPSSPALAAPVIKQAFAALPTPTPAPRKTCTSLRKVVTEAASITTNATEAAGERQSVPTRRISSHLITPPTQCSLKRQLPVSIDRPKELRYLMFDQKNATTKLNFLGNNKNNRTQQETHSKLQHHPVLTKNEESNDSASGDDTEGTEDSTENKSDKPKPGKLDLSQFDNITSAIGKLKVHASLKTSTDHSVSNSKSRVFAPQVQHENAQEDATGFFKNRARKAKSRAKEPTDQRETANTTEVKSIQSQAASRIIPSTKSTPPTSSTVSTFAGASSSGAKSRPSNHRQNHGKAVAPPQLPSSVSNTKLSSSSNIEAVSKPTHELLQSDDVEIDFSQSPIAQRLLKHSVDYRVSELNSPYESDCESSPQNMNPPGNQKLFREKTNVIFPYRPLTKVGQSLGSENSFPNLGFNNSSIDSSELINSRGAAIRQLNEILANKQPPGRLGGTKTQINRSISLDQDQQQQSIQSNKKTDKDSKKDKKKMRDDEKLEKRRLKEEERLRRQEKKQAGKKSKSNLSAPSDTVGDDGIPFFIKRCIEFIELEGLNAEGIYRVPGNRAHVDSFVQKFKENPDMSIVESDIPVNAVATALKDFLSKKWGPIIPIASMNELTELSNISDKDLRIQAICQLVNKLPISNYRLLKYVFSHFVKISLNHSLNSMDSKNLAICWWPTLLPLHFSDMVMFEQMRPHLEESIQTMIDQYDLIFQTDEPTSAVT